MKTKRYSAALRAMLFCAVFLLAIQWLRAAPDLDAWQPTLR